MQEGYEKRVKCTAYPHMELYVVLNLTLFICSIGALCLMSVEKSYVLMVINIVFAVVMPIAFLLTFIYTTFSGWNGVVTFDNQKAFQKRFGKIVEWYWDDVSGIECGTHMPWILRGYNLYPKFKLSCKSHDKILVFTLNSLVIKHFTDLCKNESVNKKFKELILQCDFDFPGKYSFGISENSAAERANIKISTKYIIYNILLLAIGIAGVALYIKQITIGYIICFSFVGVCLIVELVLYIYNKTRNSRR